MYLLVICVVLNARVRDGVQVDEVEGECDVIVPPASLRAVLDLPADDVALDAIAITDIHRSPTFCRRTDRT